MRPRIPFLLSATLALPLAISALTSCGGSSSPPAATPTPSAGAVIDQQNMAFLPATVTVKVGQTVLIKNSETVLHTANINDKNITGTMKKGDQTVWTATAAGKYQVTCDFHPLMHAVIVVEP